ncbi:hypothetical protein KKA53_04805 [Candidatus Dependentiae bacterium]|nr:hypothetical protein [Candidatus Dependentiae bacterium]
MQKESPFQDLRAKFSTGFRWSFAGSIIFESSYILHNTLLLSVLGATTYGLFGSLFSITYLVINIVDLGFESSLAPFLQMITQNKKTFQTVLGLYLFPQLFLLALGSLAALAFYSTLFTHQAQRLPAIFFIILVTAEGFRIFLRRFLHNIFFNKATVLLEQFLAIAYYLTIWVPYIFFSQPLTIKLIFVPYLINSLLAVLTFTGLIMQHYRSLPKNNFVLPKNFWKRIIKTRYYNYLINIETFLISGNFLVPFFATTFGLQQAGLFKIANIVAHSIKALVKSAIHFPGTALLASVKNKSIQVKKQAFYTLSRKLNHIIIFVIIFLAVNYNTLESFYQTQKAALLYALIFIGITLVHQLFVVYEQFYIIEELASKLFIIKSIEFILFYTLIIANKQVTPLLTLTATGLIQLLCLAILSTHAYARWKIKPYLRVNFSFVVFVIIVSFMFFGLSQSLNALFCL